MNIFEKLPHELIVMVIQQIDDFVGLESLLACSPWVNAVFRDRPRRRLLDVISINPMTQTPDIIELFRNIILIRCTYCRSFEEYRLRCRDTTNILLQYMTLSEIFEAIHVAAQIQRLACLCLSIMQQNFTNALRHTPRMHSPFCSSAPDCSRIPGASEPPIWIEEYRVYWSLWHLQHYSDLQMAAHGRWHWSGESKRTLEAYNTWAHTFSTRPNVSYLAEQILSITSVLMDLWIYPVYQEEPVWAAWEYTMETPIISFTFSRLPALLAMRTENYRVWAAPPIPRETDVETAWGRTVNQRNQPTRFTRLFRAYSERASISRGILDLRMLQPYRRLGVVFWNQWRMYTAGISYECWQSKSTPNGGVINRRSSTTGRIPRMSEYNLWSMWLQLVGKRLPSRNAQGQRKYYGEFRVC
ncbi:hypothetical protein BJX64DRAFT_280325 [Aspergillus heterothallicus]